MRNVKPLHLNQDTEVIILDKDGSYLTTKSSISKAARYCYLPSRSMGGIWRYLFTSSPRLRKNGIKSKVTGKVFHFKLK